MQASHLAARPTEYSGVVFKSKCEAIFARNIDLCRGLWEYEPEAWRLRDWVPDFWAVLKCYKTHTLASFIIEYKPSTPTDTYKGELWERFNSLQEGHPREYFILVCGNPFNVTQARTVEYFGRSGWNIVPVELFWTHWTEAMNYRFDLNPRRT